MYADGPFFNGDYGDWDGNTVEGAVANVLWDINDGVSPTDNPSWDPDGNGDRIDNEFGTFWAIFRDDKPQSISRFTLPGRTRTTPCVPSSTMPGSRSIWAILSTPPPMTPATRSWRNPTTRPWR